jgi:hypothetical protein
MNDGKKIGCKIILALCRKLWYIQCMVSANSILIL